MGHNERELHDAYIHAIKLILRLSVHPNNLLLNSEVAIMLFVQACSACYTALQMERSAFASTAVTVVLYITLWYA